MDQTDASKGFNDLISQARSYAQKYNKRPETLEEIRDKFFGQSGSDENELVFNRVYGELSVGKHRNLFRMEAGLEEAGHAPKAIEKIANEIGVENWRMILGILSSLPSDYERKVRKPRELAISLDKISRLSDELSTLIEENKLHDLFSDLESPMNGIIAKHIISENWVDALESLNSKYCPNIAYDIAKKCFYGLLLIDPSKHLSLILKEYGEILRKAEIDERTSAMMLFAGGKLSLKEFVKRVTFFLLSSYSNRKVSPNKETAIAVNVVLGLSGKYIVTANHISQMNKKTRRKYYKDAKDYLDNQSS